MPGLTGHLTEPFQHLEPPLLLRCHIIDVVKIGVKANLPGLESKECGKGQEGAENNPANSL